MMEEVTLQLPGISYRGFSYAGIATQHQLPGWQLLVDLGAVTAWNILCDTVFITHCHDDHVAGLTTHHFRRMSRGVPPANYYVSALDAGLLQQLCEIQSKLNRSRYPVAPIYPVEPGVAVEINDGRLHVIPFKVTHVIPCLGYGIWETRQKLKSEFAGMPGEALANLRKKGVCVTESLRYCTAAFSGDTTRHVLHQEGGETLRQARILFLECTFLDDIVPQKEARLGGHIHLDDIVEEAKEGAFDKNEVVVLTHFSTRYTSSEIRRLVLDAVGDTALAEKVQLVAL